METRKDSFIFYKSFYDALKMLDDNADKIRVIDALCDYAFYGLSEKGDALEGIGKAIFIIAQPLIDATIKNYENGKKGGRPSNTIQINTSKTGGFGRVKTNDNDNANLNVKDNVNLNVKDNVNLNVKENVKKIRDNNNHYLSRIPSFSEITEYISEKNLDVDPAKFFAYYEEKGWEVVDNWQKALLGWAKKRAEWKKESAEPEDEYAKLW
jgi:hypothetical protein